MPDTSSLKDGPQPDRIVRSFWHGPFSPYEALCLSSFVAAGIEVELYCEGPVAGLPDGVTRRDARSILDADVAHYQHEFDGPSPALHANHFRYALLEKLGGWWVDTDVMLVGAALPATEMFLARQPDQSLNNAVMRFPPHHPLIAAARQRAEAASPDARWGETGPQLLTELKAAYASDLVIAPFESAYAIGPEEFQKFLLPETCTEVERRIADSGFVHLWNEFWRRAGIPKNIAPPKGCWLDRMFERHQIPVVWSDRLDASQVERWATLRRDRDHAGHYNLVHDQEIKRLRAELERTRLSGLKAIFRGLRTRLRRPPA